MKQLLLAFAFILAGCATTQGAQNQRGLLRLEVEPATAEVYINSDYRGVVHGWREQTIPVKAGVLMVEIKAEGYMTQRFDIEVGGAEEVTLTLKMEPRLDVDPDPEATVVTQ